MEWEAVIGLEVHAQLATASKIFSGASTAYGAAPNTQACAVDLGLPGVLPVVNKRAIEMAVSFGLAIGAEIASESIFARKNYFYPDLPKGYQISQYEQPIVSRGCLSIAVDGQEKVVEITRAHLEEDAGKSLHDQFHSCTGIDLNRAGTPLIEIVSEPVLHSAAEAVAYLRELHRLVRYLGICDGNMQEGSYRCDANISVRPRSSNTLGTRTEIKNLNSFRFVEQAINYEIARQIDLIEQGMTVTQETRLYDPELDETRPMRSKEDAHDYRYFPDPDLLPVVVDEDLLGRLEEQLPELPRVKLQRYVDELGLQESEAAALIGDPETARYFESVLEFKGIAPRTAATWVSGEIFSLLNRSCIPINESRVSPQGLAALLGRLGDGTVSGRMAKEILQTMWDSGSNNPDGIIDERGLRQVSDTDVIDQAVTSVVEAFPEQVAEYRSGKTKLLGFLVGQVLKATQGQANPSMVNQRLREYLS